MPRKILHDLLSIEDSRQLFEGLDVAEVGEVTEHPEFVVETGGRRIISVPVAKLKKAWKAPFKDL